MRRRILISISTILALLLVIWLYIGIRGRIISIKKFSDNEKETIVSTYNLSISDDDKILSFNYMTYATETFYVLEIEPEDIDNFCERNSAICNDVNHLKSKSIIFPTRQFQPSNKIFTTYVYDDVLYISTWGFENKNIRDLFFELYHD